MELISLYFSKYQNIGVESRTTKKILMEVLKEVSKVEIESTQIKIEKSILILTNSKIFLFKL
jgi:hypothetical protein